MSERSSSIDRALDGLKLRPGAVFTVLEERPNLGYLVVKRYMASDFKALVLTRQFPPDLERQMGLEGANIYWLTSNINSKTKSISPSAITRLNFVVTEFMQSEGDGIIILDCLEYLVTQNNFETILRVLQAWNDKIVGSRTRLILSLDPLTLSIQQLHLIKRETEEILKAVPEPPSQGPRSD